MKSITSKFKIWIILTLAVLVAGMVLLGVFGLNSSVDYSESYEISVSVDQDAKGSAEQVKACAEKYFSDKNLSFSEGKVQIIDDGLGKTYIYKFSSETGIVETELQTALQSALSANADTASYKASANVSVVKASMFEASTGKVLIALAVALVVAFIYLVFMEKFASALTVSCCSVISALLFVSLIAITRIAVNASFGLYVAGAFTFGGILSVVMCSRFREIAKLVSNDKLSAKEIADQGASQSLLRIIFFTVALLIASAVLIIVGATYLKVVGLTLVAVCVASAFSALVFTPAIWSAIKSKKNA